MAKQANVNLTPTTGAVAVFELVDFLGSSLAFDILAEGDGTTYESDSVANGRLITSGASGAGGLGNANAWIRVREPGGAGGREWVFQRDASNNTDWRVKLSAIDGFTGGTPSATETPSATDEQVIHGSGTDASPTHAALFPADGTYRWHLVGFDTAEGGVYPWYASSHVTGTGLSRTLIMVDSLASGSYPELVGTRASPTSGEPDPAVYCCAYSTTQLAHQVAGSTGQWAARLAAGRHWFAMNGSNGNAEAFVECSMSTVGHSSASGDVAMPADSGSSDGFGVNPLDGTDPIMAPTYGRSAGHGTSVGPKGVSAHVRISGVDRGYPSTVTIGTERWFYTATPNGILLPFEDGTAPLT